MDLSYIHLLDIVERDNTLWCDFLVESDSLLSWKLTLFVTHTKWFKKKLTEISYLLYKERIDNRYENDESFYGLSYSLIFIALHSSFLFPLHHPMNKKKRPLVTYEQVKFDK